MSVTHMSERHDNVEGDAMNTLKAALAAGLMLTSVPLIAQAITTPEGALMDAGSDLAYKPGALTQAELMAPTRSLFAQSSMNVFRRFPRDRTEAMIKFYTGALALRSLNPIQLTASQQMLLTGVGSGQIKLSAGQQGNRKYDLAGGYKGGTGIRFLTLTYPDAAAVTKRFTDAGFAAPTFVDQGDGTKAAMVTDPAGLTIQLVVRPGAKDHSDDGVGVGINVSGLKRSRAFYREFVGLDELPAVKDKLLGITKYPYRHQETTLFLYKVGSNLAADTGSTGIQYVVRDAPMVDAKGKARHIAVETPLNRLRGFDLTTVWLNDPDGVTNYFAQPGPKARTPVK
jgi:catechol 2,3-dioxygenase-like lactoylglutathione lyase family enzyme